MQDALLEVRRTMGMDDPYNSNCCSVARCNRLAGQSERTLQAILVMFVCIFGATAMFGQTSNGTIAGTVTDVTGAVVSGASVTALSLQTGETRSAITSNIGAFRIDSITPGVYRVSIKAQGFAATTLQNVQVSASLVASGDAVLKPGSATETVEVQANASSQLQTDTGELSGVLGTTEVQNLPISNSNAYALATNLPGVSQVTSENFTNGTSFSVFGTRPRANNFLIEGQDNNDNLIHGQGLQPGNPEAVKEVTVLTNSYASEFGGGGGSVSNLIYMRGGNQFHGAVYEKLLNSSLDAADKGDILQGTPKAKYRENLFGFRFGGPIKQNKLFFFGSYQWDNYRSSANGNVLSVPTVAGVATLQSLPQNQRITNLLQAIGTLRGSSNTSLPNYSCLLLGNDPTTGIARPCVAVNSVQRTLPNQSNAPELDTTGDWVLNSKDSIHLRYIRTSYDAPYDTFNYPGQLPGFDATQNGKSHNAGIVETHVFSPRLLDEFRASYSRIGFNFDFQPATYANPLGTAPTTSISGLTGFGAPGGDPQGRFHNTYQFQNAVSWTKGNHFLKFGADIDLTQVRDQIPFNFYGSIGYAGGTSGYSALANYIDNFGGSSAQVTQNFGSPIARPFLVAQSYYAQDNWKARSNLTIDYGLRYEYNGAPFNSAPYPAFNENNPLCFPCRITEQADGDDFGPRLGVAYTPRFMQQIFGKDKTVIRAAFGVFYDGLFTNIIDNIQAEAPNAAAPLVTSSVTSANPRGTANWSSTFASLSKTPSIANTQEPIVPHLLSPETLQWNVNIERLLPSSFLLNIGYVGTRGEHLFGSTEFNALNPATGGRRISTLGNVIVRDNGGDSNYQGGFITINRNVGKGLVFRTSYTYSRFLDDVSEIFTSGNFSTYAERQYPYPRKQIDWGLSALDNRHRLVFSYVYSVPRWQATGGLRAVSELVTHWQVSGITQFQSGNPGNVEVGTDVNGDGITNDRPILGNRQAPMASYAFDASWFGSAPGSGYCDGPSYWFTNLPCQPVNASAVHWLVPPFGTNASVIGRNNVITQSFNVWNFSLQRNFPLYQEHGLDFRAEMFNVFNHGNTGTPNLTLTSGIVPAGFGNTSFADYPATVGGHRNVRIFVRYSF